MKKLPIGVQSFEKLRNNGCLYVDKTEIIYQLISDGTVLFLSRPRRFGKSLLVSTIEAIFKGQKELFEGLYIYDKWDWSQNYPVIRIDWTLIDHSTPEKMEAGLSIYLKRLARDYQITLAAKSAPDCFSELIKLLHDKNGNNVVILIDEYDKPVTEHLFSHHLKPITTALHNIYQVMKGSDEYLKFIFLTGVSKFSGLSVFSALNNLRDISLNENYAAICGYTQKELEDYFAEYIDETANHLSMTKKELLEQIQYWYNGYTWDGKTAIYNPFSTLNFFSEREFGAYWFSTGTPTFLIEIIQRRNHTTTMIEPFTVSGRFFNGYKPSDIEETPLLFQTGYLTIKHKEVNKGIPSYVLGVPNSEVNEAFLTCLLKSYGKYPDEQIDNLRLTMERQIKDCDEAGFNNSLEAMIATVPYELHHKNEAYYHTIMLIWLRLLGFKIQGETPNNRGRSDIVWEQPGLTVVAELKYHSETKIETLLKNAIEQIHDLRYYNKYIGKVLLLGVAFSGKDVGCKMEVINR